MTFYWGDRSLKVVETLDKDLKSAKKIFEIIDSPRAKWGRAFVDILSGYIENYPSYFEIRNFLEIDLDFLIKNEKRGQSVCQDYEEKDRIQDG